MHLFLNQLEKFWVRLSNEPNPDKRVEMAREMVAGCRISSAWEYGKARGAGCGSDLEIIRYVHQAIKGDKHLDIRAVGVAQPELAVLTSVSA